MDKHTEFATTLLATDVEVLLQEAMHAIEKGAKIKRLALPTNQNWTIYDYGGKSLLAVGEPRSRLEGDRFIAERDVVKLWYFE